ncbi:STX17 [Lepeophtheirus salmonis]|uniref:STX17 n=2 Tax=Lepeophtheirus salmonis TaxID=72036 RepID=A0A7R8CPY9_LEPSM|nr:STX17 [Lepeophtheirus salmonis]CAF2890225.1 STX17 [Lepeophtheirus salmonis]
MKNTTNFIICAKGSSLSKRLEITLDKFSQVALPFHLNQIYKHKKNIERLQRLGDWEEVSREVNRATKSVHQLGVLLFEIEILRTYVEEPDLNYFDVRVNPAKTSTLVAVHGLQEMCPVNLMNAMAKEDFRKFDEKKGNNSNSTSFNALTYCSNPLYNEREGRISGDGDFGSMSLTSSSRAATNIEPQQGTSSGSPIISSSTLSSRRAPIPPPLVLPPDLPLIVSAPGTPPLQTGTLEILYEDPKEDSVSMISTSLEDEDLAVEGDERSRLISSTSSIQTKHNKEQELKNRDLESRKETFKAWGLLHEEIKDLQELISEFSPVVSKEHRRHKVNSSSPRSSHLSSTAIYPVAGALLGTCLGGPVGFLAGIKIGGLAAIGGSVFGYSTGIVIKEQVDRQEYIDDFYAHRSRSQRIRIPPPPPSISTTPIISKQQIGNKRAPLLRDRTQSLPDVYNNKSKANGMEVMMNGELGRSRSVRTRHIPPTRNHHITLYRCDSANSSTSAGISIVTASSNTSTTH